MSTRWQPVGDHTVADNNRASGCQHQGNRRPFCLTGSTRGAPAYCSQVSAFGYYTVPLKHWPKRARTNNLKSKFHDRKLVACEVAALGEQEFMAKYSPDDVTLVKLKSLIRDRNNRNKTENETGGE